MPRCTRGAERAGRGGVDASRILYVGESLGGAVALTVEFAPVGLILQSTFTNVRDLARVHCPLLPARVIPDAYPSLARIPRLRAPLLVVHGERDEIVPLSLGGVLFEAAPARKRMRVVLGVGHNDLVSRMGADYAGPTAA